MVKETPLMKQYAQVKAKYPGAILLFRIGDFYETFGEDAIVASKVLGIVLTKRANGSASHIELAGFPHHSLDTYLPKLVRAGHRVAICDQLEDPKLAKTIVKRGVTELVSPGVAYSDKMLDHKSNNYLASVFFENSICGIAFLDISTGEFFTAEGNIEYIDRLLRGHSPSEIILSKNQRKDFSDAFGNDFYIYALDEWIYTFDFSSRKLLEHFKSVSLKGFGINEMHCGITAAGAILHYLHENQHTKLEHIISVSRIDESQYVWLDRFTIRNLEILSSQNEKGKSLIDVLDETSTSMGGRLLKRWLIMPLKEVNSINNRLSVVEYFYNEKSIADKLNEILKQSGDLERLASKASLGRMMPREMLQLAKSLQLIPMMKEIFNASGNASLLRFSEILNDCKSIVEKIISSLLPEPPATLGKGNIIANGINSELDDLRKISFSGKDYLVQMQQKESERTEIPSLKISFNNVFGYYIEVTNAHKNKVPDEWIRKQTLTNAERYITPELKEYEEKILGAEEKIQKIEEQIYLQLISELAVWVSPIKQNAHIVAQVDCLLNFAIVSKKNNYTKPELNDSYTLQLNDSRHPVIERNLATGEEYIANNVSLDNDEQQVIILTGPNMSGKSALLRQTALCVLMAQAGCFVPCSGAKIGVVDKIFTRVGASDNLSGGESTFMVEMLETASILNNISSRSLIILDEIGRGTSTYDGVSLAWSIAEFLYKNKHKPKTLFATHYHELNELEKNNKGIKNYHITVKEIANKIIFLRKIIRGGSEHSFGIHVARIAGVPLPVTERAEEVLLYLEQQRENTGTEKAIKNISKSEMQLSMFTLDDPTLEKIREELLKIEINTTSPVEALLKLSYLKKIAEN